jgi:hypothetical protein
MTTIPMPPPIVPGNVITQEFRTPKTVQRGIAAGVVGNMLEWYDFALFGFFAPQIGAHFFPAHDPTSSVLTARSAARIAPTQPCDGCQAASSAPSGESPPSCCRC